MGLNDQKNQHLQSAAVDHKKERIVPGEESSTMKTKWRGSRKSWKTEDFFHVHQIGDIPPGIALNLQRKTDSRLTTNSQT